MRACNAVETRRSVRRIARGGREASRDMGEEKVYHACKILKPLGDDDIEYDPSVFSLCVDSGSSSSIAFLRRKHLSYLEVSIHVNQYRRNKDPHSQLGGAAVVRDSRLPF